ncbi:MAG: glycosyltransferase family 2 protein [Anaerolineae bacterium]
MTLVSVVTPSYNQARYLEHTLRSVLEQDYPHIEYIVIDGASTDGSVDIIRHYADRLAYWVSEKDNGQAEAINKGFSHAHGEILAWLNSDDYYLPGAVSAAVATFAAHPQAVLVYGNMLAVNAHGEIINHLRYRQLRLEDLLGFEIIGQPAVFFRRSAFEKTAGLDATFHFLLDHLLWIKIAQQGEIVHAEQTWAAARYHPMAKNIARPLEFVQEVERIAAWIESQPSLARALTSQRKRILAGQHCLSAFYLVEGGEARRALWHYRQALLAHPPTLMRSWKRLTYALLTLIGLEKAHQLYVSARQKFLHLT